MAALPSDFSARRTLTGTQYIALAVVAVPIGLCAVAAPISTATALIGLATLLYVAALIYRLEAYWLALRDPRVAVVTDAEARSISDEDLPVYSVLVPAYREPTVIAALILRLSELEYPADKLDIRLLLEEDDHETIAAAAAALPGPQFTIVRVPHSQPKTKPKACNYGLKDARGDFLTIYDAEDHPEPLQLRRAVVAFGRLGSSVACLQAKLSYYNAEQNLLTAWFTIEYSMWFSFLLPGLVAQRGPLPLGGTSNHFRGDVLRAVGGWDPYNVTEDADLGIRLARLGFKTQVLDSTTYEEANSDVINWIKQRSRWYKGYLQTWLVHVRHPLELRRQLGWRGFVGFNLFVAGTPVLSLINPIFWILTLIWFTAHPAVILALFPAWLYYLGLAVMVVGNSLLFYTWLVTARIAGSHKLVFASLLVPFYWALMSLAGIKAAVQLVSAPSFWEKTVHGLDGSSAHEVPGAVPGNAAALPDPPAASIRTARGAAQESS
jgi:cellulose synthase/poly-beta-1,6-N-acetylglucosamine synthase-like glycosyltransferase